MRAMRAQFMLLFIAGLCVLPPTVSDAETGTYRCLLGVPQGGVGWITHHNPTTISQKVTRVRVWNSAGEIALDTGTIAFIIPANGSDVPLSIDGTVEGFVGDAFQVLVNWSQTQDKAAPIPRTDMFPDGSFASAVRTSCP